MFLYTHLTDELVNSLNRVHTIYGSESRKKCVIVQREKFQAQLFNDIRTYVCAFCVTFVLSYCADECKAIFS